MSYSFTPSSLSDVAVPADSVSLNVGDKKPLDFPVIPLNSPDLDKHPDDNSPSGQPGGYADQSSGFDSGNAASKREDDDVPPQPLTLERWLQAGGVQPFHYDPNLSNEENLSGIFNWMNSVFDLYRYSSSDGQMNFGNLLSYVFSSLNNSKNNYIRDLSDSASLELAEKITDVTFSFINQMYNQAASLQAWYIQQEYNSPLSQINRLTEAGLNSAFALGGLNSGNASSPASVPMLQQPSASNAGQAQQQSEGSWLSFLGAGLSAAASFIPGVGGAVGTLINTAFQQFVGRKMLPYNIAQAGADLVNAGQSFLNLREANDQMKANIALQSFTSGKESIESENRFAESQVNSAKDFYMNLFQNHSEEFEDQAWETIVLDASGHQKRYSMSTEDVKRALSNHGRIDSNLTILGSDSWSNAATGKATVELGKRNSSSNSSSSSSSSSSESQNFGNKDFSNLSSESYSKESNLSSNLYDYLGVSGSTTVEDTYTKSHTDSRTSSKGHSQESGIIDESDSSKVGYNENGTEFRIGDSVFKSIVRRYRMPLPQFAEQIESARKSYESLLDRYNTLTEGNKARLHILQDTLTRNISKLSSGVVKSHYQKLINDMLTPNPNTLVGD